MRALVAGVLSLALASLLLAAPARAADRRAHAAKAPRKPVLHALRRLRRSGAIDGREYHQRHATLRAALRTEGNLTGRRALELGGVIANLREIAAAGKLTVSRLPALFLTLERNREWWSQDRLLPSGERVSFPGSEVVWEEYYGQGLELQMLGNFGKANALWKDHEDQRLEQLLDALIPLAADRAGGIAWEYYFRFGSGVPPWTSAISQGTAIQALARAAQRLDRPDYLDDAREALGVFDTPPPEGVRGGGRHRSFYLLYSFAPGMRVLNAFIQSLVGLYDLAENGHVARAARLFRAGDREARRVVPDYDTGAWSLYQPGEEADLNYHTLNRDFLQHLCDRKPRQVYCETARHFTEYLHQPPVLDLVTRRLRGGRPGEIVFDLSKISRVGITVRRGTRTAFETSAQFPHGRNAVGFEVPRRRGRYAVTLYGTDLAGNHARVTRTVHVHRPRHHHRHRHR